MCWNKALVFLLVLPQVRSCHQLSRQVNLSRDRWPVERESKFVSRVFVWECESECLIPGGSECKFDWSVSVSSIGV